MKITLHHNYTDLNSPAVNSPKFSVVKLWNRLIAFAEQQEPYRLFWMAIGIFGHGTIVTPATMGVIFYTGNIFGLLIAVCFSMILVIIVTLAALPTKYIIPVFLLSLVIDILLAVFSLLHFLFI